MSINRSSTYSLFRISLIEEEKPETVVYRNVSVSLHGPAYGNPPTPYYVRRTEDFTEFPEPDRKGIDEITEFLNPEAAKRFYSSLVNDLMAEI